MIGNDLIPNTYIDRVTVYDNSVEVSVYCVDSRDEPTWSGHSTSLKYFKIMVVFTTNTTLITSFRHGIIKMDKNEILKEDPDAKIFFYRVNNLTPVFNKGFNNYKIKATYNHPSPNSLNVYASMIADPVEIAGSKFVNDGYISGPVASEAIYESGELIQTTTIWTLPNGQQWVGPVHRHPTNGYMQFSSHSDAPHQPVTRTTINNLKMKDLRTKTFYSRSISGRKNNVAEVSNLFSSFDSSGVNNSIFFMNLKEVVGRNTKFGNAFLALRPEYYKRIIDAMRFRLVKIERKMVRTAIINSKTKINKILETKNVLSAYQSGNAFITTFGNGLLQKRIFPFNDEIHCFEFVDTDATTSLSGQFQYDVSFYFADPTIEAVNNIVSELGDAKKAVDKYLGRIKRNLKTNEERTNPPEEWISSEVAIFEDLSLAPWILAPTIFAKYKLMFFDTSETIESIEFDSYKMLDPRTFTMNSINKFMSKLNNLISHVHNTFNVRTSPVSNYSDISMPKNSYISNLIEKKFHFHEIIEPSKNKKFYNILDETPAQTFTKRITLNSFKDRIRIERNKFFAPQAKSDPSSVETDIETSVASFFTPFSLKQPNGDKIDLTNLNNIDKQRFNTFFDNVPKTRTKRNFKSRKKNKFTITPRIIPIEEEKYINSRDYLGDDSNFVLPVENGEVVKKVKKASKKTQSNISNRVTKKKTKSKNKLSPKSKNNIFSKPFQNRLSAVTVGRPLIPNQLRALNPDLTPQINQTFSSEEIVEAENELMVQVNYLTLTQIEALTGFGTSSDGVLNLTNPIWDLVTTEIVEDLGEGTLCKIERIKSPTANFEPDPRTDLPFSDSYFIIANEELPASNNLSPEVTNNSLIDNFNSSNAFDIAGASSQIITQNLKTEADVFKVKIEEFEIEVEQGTTSPTVSRGTGTNVSNRRTNRNVVRSSTTGRGGY